MNLSEHVRVTAVLHVEMSVIDHPELTRVIGVPRDAPSSWVVEAYLLSLGIEPDSPDFDDEYDAHPLIDLIPWRSVTQRTTIPGVAELVDVVIRGPFAARMGDPLVTVVHEECAGTGEQPQEEALGAQQGEGDTEGSVGWQVRRPSFRAERVAFELARRFGLVQPYFEPSDVLAFGGGLRSYAPIATLAESLSPVRRLALLAHLEESGVLDAASPDASAIESATEGLRMLVARIGPDGIEQDLADGGVPRAVVSEVVGALGWPDAPPPGLPDPADALLALARRTKSIRRLRGRVVVTNLGRSLVRGEVRAFAQIIAVVREIGEAGRFPSGQPRKVTLSLLALADGAAATFDDLPGQVALGEAAVVAGQGDMSQYSEWFPRSYREREGAEGSGDRYAVQRVVEGLCALSAPGAFGVVTPAMRVVAGAALR